MKQHEHLLHNHELSRVTPVTGGHMNYERLLIDTPGAELYFAKLHDAAKFSDPVREQHSREYLHKEHAMMSHLRREGYDDIPSHSKLIDTHSLVMEGLPEADGWQWRAPHNSIDTYIDDVSAALTRLERVPYPPDFFDSHAPAHDALLTEGWTSLDDQKIQTIHRTIEQSLPRLQPRMHAPAKRLGDVLQSLRQTPLPTTPPSRLCHHDMHQANLAWHEHHVVRIVDWSWAGIGLEHADHTSLLIDLHKSGHDITRYLSDFFNPEHAHLLLGFLLGRAIAPKHGGNDEVRFHQAVSAVSAFDLLDKQEMI